MSSSFSLKNSSLSFTFMRLLRLYLSFLTVFEVYLGVLYILVFIENRIFEENTLSFRPILSSTEMESYDLIIPFWIFMPGSTSSFSLMSISPGTDSICLGSRVLTSWENPICTKVNNNKVINALIF